MIDIFEKIGYRVYIDELPDGITFDVLWSHEFPFSNPKLQKIWSTLRPYQKVNHVFGSGYYTSKVS